MDETDISLFGGSKKKNQNKEKTDSHGTTNNKSIEGVISDLKPAIKLPIRSVSTNEDTYDTRNPRVGIALIFNHKEIRNQEPRKGTERDRKRIEGTLKMYGFDVRTYNDLNFKDLSEVLKGASHEDHSTNDCLVVVVMSHGVEGKIFAKDMLYPVERLWTPFLGDNCKSLINKPKLFFIQACRGNKLDQPVVFTTRAAPMTGIAEEKHENTYAIPTTADLLVFYSTYEGHYSFRNVENGSWFIQCLCMVLEQAASQPEKDGTDIFRLLTAVNRKVAYEYQSLSQNKDFNEMKEMPNFVSTLTKMFYLKVKPFDK